MTRPPFATPSKPLKPLKSPCSFRLGLILSPSPSSDQIVLYGKTRYSLSRSSGEKSERGSHHRYSIIKYEPVAAYVDDPWIWVWRDGGGSLGSFHVKNLFFDVETSGASCLWFGNFTAPYLPISDASTPGVQLQRYIQGILIENCEFRRGANAREPDANFSTTLRFKLSPQYVLRFTKCFQTIVRNCTMWENGHAVWALGCDKLNIRSTRIRAQFPVELIRSGSFGVQHTITDFQSEGWAFSPIINRGPALSIADCRIEANLGTSSYLGKYDLTSNESITAQVTEDSNSITFSSSVTEIVHPDYSILELEDPLNPSNKVLAKLETLSTDGLTGTITGTDALRIKWSSPNAILRRVHNYGILHDGGSYGTQITNLDGTSKANTPSLVWILSQGSMYAINCSQTISTTTANAQAAVIGNLACLAGSAQGGQLVVSGNARFAPYNRHPRLKVLNYAEQQGDYGNNAQPATAEAYDVISKVENRWVFSPDRGLTATNFNKDFTVDQLTWAADGSNRVINAWLFDISAANLLVLRCPDVPSSRRFKVKLLAKPRVAGSYASLDMVWAGAGGGTSVWKPTLDSDDLKVYQTVVTTAPWTDTGRSIFLYCNTHDAYIAAVILEEFSEENEITPSSAEGGIYKVSNRGRRSVDTTTPAAVNLFSFDAKTDTGVLQLGIQVSSNGGYSRRFQRWIVQYGRNGGSLYATAAQEGSDIFTSVNAAVYNPTNSVTLSTAGNVITVQANPNETVGANKTVQVDYFWDTQTQISGSTY